MKQFASVLALASVVFVSNSFADNFAERIVSYSPGAGAAAGFNDPMTALGAPSQVNPFGESTDPFNPPYGTNQIVSIGEGGSLTVKFDKPVHNHKHHPFHLDFIVFGNSGFVITNDFDLNTYEWIGTPATDGSMFANNPGGTRVSVSRDGEHFYVLDPELTPSLDNLFPTDGAGDVTQPVDPALHPSDFAGQTWEGVRTLYGGAAGGAGFNIAWARDKKGRHAHLSFIKYVRIEVLSGKIEVDALSATKHH